MAIPESAYPPPFNVTRASHVVLTVKDLGASRAFYVDTLGFIVSEQEPAALYLRGIEEACHHSVVLKQSSASPACERVGLRVFSEDDLDRAFVFLSKGNLTPEWVEVPHQCRTLHVTDPVGTRLEICASMPVKPRLVVQFQEQRGAVPLRLDHFQVLCPEVAVACSFYASIGFRLSEYVAIDGTDDLVFAFLQRKGNPHDIVFANGTGPRLHHFAISVPDSQHVIQACDIAGTFGYGAALEAGPGRHGPGHALFAYFRDPDGHRVEFFNTHYQVMDIENEPVRWDASALRKRPWGLPPRKRWYEEATMFRNTHVREPVEAGAPATLESVLLADAEVPSP